MTAPTQSESTIRLVSLISLMKKMELCQSKKRILEIEKRIELDTSNSIHRHRYNLVNSRSKQLRTTIENLRQLELQLIK